MLLPPEHVSMFGNGGMNHQRNGMYGRLADESNPRFYQTPRYHHDSYHRNGSQSENIGMGSQMTTLSSCCSSINPFQQRTRLGVDSVHHQQLPQLRSIATSQQEEGRFLFGVMLSWEDEQSIIHDALDVLRT